MKKKLMEKLVLFIAIVLFPLWIFLYHLQNNPPGFFIDEAINGYEAYTLIKTHGFSSTGEFLPRLFTFAGGDGTRNHHSYIYFILPFVGLFGINEVAVRLTSVVSSIALLFVIYIFVRKKVSFLSFILAALCWPLISWVFLISRIGMEFMTTALFFMLSLFLLERWVNTKPKHEILFIILLGICISILFYVYAAGKVLAVGCLGLAAWITLKEKKNFGPLILLTSFLISNFSLSYSYIKDGSFFYRSSELLHCDVNPFLCFILNFGTHFTFNSYFINYIPPDFPVLTHSIIDTSLIPLFLAPFLFIGICVLLYRRDFFSQLLFFASLIAVMPASLTSRGFDSYRSVALLPILFICIIWGINITLQFFHKRSVKGYYLSIVLLILYLSFFGLRESRILFAYEYHVEASTVGGWQYGYRPILHALQKYYDKYDYIFVSRTLAYFPSYYIQFFDPQKKYSKISIVNDDPPIDRKALYVLRTDELSGYGGKIFVVHETIFYPDGVNKAFFIGEFKE